MPPEQMLRDLEEGPQFDAAEEDLEDWEEIPEEKMAEFEQMEKEAKDEYIKFTESQHYKKNYLPEDIREKVDLTPEELKAMIGGEGSQVLDDKFEEAYRILDQRLFNEDLGTGDTKVKKETGKYFKDHEEGPEVGGNQKLSYRDQMIHKEILQMQSNSPTASEKRHFFRGEDEHKLRMERQQKWKDLAGVTEELPNESPNVF